MPRMVLTPQQIVATGLEATFSAANADGHSIINSPNMFIECNNASGGDITVTIQTPATVNGLAVAEQTVVVTAGERRHIGPFPNSVFNQTDGTIYVDFSGVTTFTIAALKF